MANAFMTGAVRLTVPETLLVRLEGALPPGLTAKDIVLRDMNAGAKSHKVTVLFACTCDNDTTRRGQCITCGMKERGTKLFENFAKDVA